MVDIPLYETVTQDFHGKILDDWNNDMHWYDMYTYETVTQDFHGEISDNENNDMHW